MLETVKMLLGITDTSRDSILTWLIGAVMQKVLDHTRQKTLPTTAEALVIEMAITRYRAGGYGQQAAPQIVSGVSEGDVSVTYKTTQYNATSELTEAEKTSLAPYRKLWP